MHNTYIVHTYRYIHIVHTYMRKYIHKFTLYVSRTVNYAYIVNPRIDTALAAIIQKDFQSTISSSASEASNQSAT